MPKPDINYIGPPQFDIFADNPFASFTAQLVDYQYAVALQAMFVENRKDLTPTEEFALCFVSGARITHDYVGNKWTMRTTNPCGLHKIVPDQPWVLTERV